MIEVDQKIKVRYRISPFSKNYYVDQEEKKKIPVPEIYAGINDLFAGLSCIHRSISEEVNSSHLFKPINRQH